MFSRSRIGPGKVPFFPSNERTVKSSLPQKPKARAIAFYLPQFHPIPENDNFWGKGFTEWTNVAKAKPLFKGHFQPHLPADLGFYDLRIPEVREQQAELARNAGIAGFCYWHYWFGNGRRVLERIFNEVLVSGKPDFPFCLAWANESWTGRWHGLDQEILVEQTFPGPDDYRAHFLSLLPAFQDKRYMEVDGRKLFLIYHPHKLPDAGEFVRLWNRLAQEHGFKGFYFLSGSHYYDDVNNFFDAFVAQNIGRKLEKAIRRKYRTLGRKFFNKIFEKISHRKPPAHPKPMRFSYSDYIETVYDTRCSDRIIPCAIPNWDNTPRAGLKGLVLENSTPELFGRHLETLVRSISHRSFDQRLLIIKSWNEWAEGNYLEPDQQFGSDYLKACRAALIEAEAR